jgi:c-di-GMP-binding flagellar brake protein YcgR
VQLAWVGKRIPELEVARRPVEVRFAYEGEHYVFVAVTRGRQETGFDEQSTNQTIQLSLPLRLERARQRQQLRLELPDQPPITATFTHVVDDRRQFRARLRDIGDGGLGVVANAGEVSELHTGDLFWADVTLPGEKTHSELVVRLMHLRPVSGSDEIVMGWAFQPTDDVENYENYLRRLEAFVARR